MGQSGVCGVKKTAIMTFMHEQQQPSTEVQNRTYDQEELVEFMQHSRVVGEWYQAYIHYFFGFLARDLETLFFFEVARIISTTNVITISIHTSAIE